MNEILESEKLFDQSEIPATPNNMEISNFQLDLDISSNFNNKCQKINISSYSNHDSQIQDLLKPPDKGAAGDQGLALHNESNLSNIYDRFISNENIATITFQTTDLRNNILQTLNSSAKNVLIDKTNTDLPAQQAQGSKAPAGSGGKEHSIIRNKVKQ